VIEAFRGNQSFLFPVHNKKAGHGNRTGLRQREKSC
jgi:hypothetical protein